MSGTRRFRVQVGPRTHDVEIDASGRATVDGRPMQVDAHPGRAFAVRAAESGEETAQQIVFLGGGAMPEHASVRGHSLAVEVVSEQQARLRDALGRGSAAGGAGKLEAPMPGRVVKILVAAGDAVAPGDPLVVVEAMKMENELSAAIAGSVSEVAVSEGDTVDAGQLLCVVTPQD